MAKIVNLLGCLFVSLAFAYGQANDGAERLASLFNQLRDDNNAHVVCVQYTGGDFEKAGGGFLYQTSDYPNLQGQLGGFCQEKNTNTLLTALPVLHERDIRFTESDVRKGFAHVCELTGLMGRWQRLAEHPTLICDTGHNVGGIQYIVEQLRQQPCDTLRIVFGMVNDKDINGVLELLPRQAVYYFTQASVKRAMPAHDLQALAASHGLDGRCYDSVETALRQAQEEAGANDCLFVGGSSFIVADLLTALQGNRAFSE